MPHPPQTEPPGIAVSWQDEADRQAAEELAGRLHLPLANEVATAFRLAMRGGRLQLEESGADAAGPVYVDFCGGRAHYRRLHGGGRSQALARAVGLKKKRCPMVVDATAGLGRDAFVLASLGCKVRLVERSAILHALLADGMRRARHDAEISAIMARMTLTHGDCLQLNGADLQAEVIYLDPMYPHRSKSSLVKKEMRLTRALVCHDPDADLLLDWAFPRRPQRIVVKRPKGAPFLGNKKPPLIIKNKQSRFDIYFPPSG